ncbi:MAG: type II toxin-antitoxin system HicB family antitoxin [Acidobacteriota bacterium]
MNNILDYKGYKAKIEFSADDNVFVGRLIGVNEIVVFDAETVEGLKESMRLSVDFYIQTCKAEGKKLKKNFSGKVLFRLPNTLHERIAEAAARHNKSINEWGKEVFETAVNS